MKIQATHMLAVSCVLTCAAIVPAAATDSASRPNLIVILADDLGYGDLSCYGHPHFKTPRLDQMAAEGVRLTHFQAPMAYCAPTRASLLTGRYPFRCGMNDNPAPDANPAADTRHLPDDEILLPQLLRKAGYATAMVGKWHLGHRNPEHLPTRRGFDEYLGILYSNDMRPVRLLDGEKVVEDPAVQATLTQRYTERALQFMQAHRRQPFFLYVAHAMPHKPLAASEAFYRKSGAGLYGDVMAELDWSVGRILDALKDLELDQNTLVIFTSDNGPWFGGSTGGLRGMKGSSFEGGYRVPFLARWPGVLPKGALRDQPAVMMDVFTTLLHAAHVTLPPDRVIDGQNLLPYLTTNESPPHDHVFGQAGPRLATIRDGRWKLHVLKPNARRSLSPGETWVDPRGPDGTTILAPVEQSHPSEFPGLETGDAAQPMMLFDLLNDPGEQRDVAGQHHEVVQRLKAAYETMNTALSETPPRP